MSEYQKIRDSIDTYCGLCCRDCQLRESMNCGGCIATGGHPFHGECALAQCAIEKKRGFCGECPQFPCELLERFSSDLEHGDTPPGARIAACSRTKARMVAAAREGLDPQGVCGHHCDHCPYTQWCGGCRSVYPGCSFATLYEDGKCPNTACAGERELDGCYGCPDLDGCQKGYFGAEDGYTAMGAARFIAKHGKEAYARALEQAGERPGELRTAEELVEFYEKLL